MRLWFSSLFCCSVLLSCRLGVVSISIRPSLRLSLLTFPPLAPAHSLRLAPLDTSSENQSTGLERFELLAKLDGVDVFDMKPLKVERLGTMKEPISVYSLVSLVGTGGDVGGASRKIRRGVGGGLLVDLGLRVGMIWVSEKSGSAVGFGRAIAHAKVRWKTSGPCMRDACRLPRRSVLQWSGHPHLACLVDTDPDSP